MTIRLVGLMGLVLLISLAAFAFLTHSYQAEVMDGVNRTISQVGRATLRTFDYRFGPPVDDGAAVRMGRKVLEAHHELRMEFPSGPAEGGPGEGPVVRRAGSFSADGPGVGVVILTRFGALPGGGCGEAPACEGRRLEELLDVEAVLEEGEPPADGDLDGAQNAFFIQVDQVRAEADPAQGTVLRIPALLSPGRHWIRSREEGGANEFQWASGTGGADAPHPAARHEILLPIETDEFQALFASFRQRTLLMFVAVFLLGMLLSGGLVTRFTRPVRRLDAGIRRLTDGELEVEVEAHGRDEIGRLGRAFNEMTRRLRASKQRERELTRREKLSALGRLAAGVAHDVRNPLHSIGLTLQNLRETCAPEEGRRRREFERLLAIIRAEIGRLDRLVGNFLQFARSDRRSRDQIDLVQLLRDTAALVEKEAERRDIRLQIVTESDIRPFAADAESIRSSILNLVMNSFEAMSDGGVLTLKVTGSGEEVLVEVCDTGRGIPQEDQERVFEFAYTTREDGHGLGLAMVHQVVVEDHGGRVSLESRPGEGTRIRLAFPLLPAGAGA